MQQNLDFLIIPGPFKFVEATPLLYRFHYEERPQQNSIHGLYTAPIVCNCTMKTQLQITVNHLAPHYTLSLGLHISKEDMMIFACFYSPLCFWPQHIKLRHNYELS